MPDAPPPPKLIRFPALTASVLAAITTAVLGSFIGTAGTLAGAGLASAVGGVATALYERGIERAAAKARTKRTGRPPSPQAQARGRKLASRKVVIRSAAAGVGIAVVTLAVITATEYAAGRPVSDLVQGKHGTGLSVTGGGSVAHPATPPVTPTPTVPATAPASPPTGTTTPATVPPAPSATVTTAAPSASPTATPATHGPAFIPSTSATPIPSASPSPGETPP